MTTMWRQMVPRGGRSAENGIFGIEAEITPVCAYPAIRPEVQICGTADAHRAAASTAAEVKPQFRNACEPPLTACVAT